MYVDDEYLLNRKKRKKNKAEIFGNDENNRNVIINQEEKFPGELSDEDAYTLDKP